jgi:protein ImuB
MPGLRMGRPPASGEREPSGTALPLVVAGRRGNAECLVAVDEAAERLGLTVGTSLAQARAIHPALAVEAEDADADARLLAAIADWCQRYTPLTAVAPPDGLLLDISGCAHLFGDEERLRDDLIWRLTRFGFAASAAVAGTIGAAWAAAHFSATGIVSSGDEHSTLAPLPLAALRLPAETVAVMARVGLKRIGDIVDLPRAPLAARFESDLLRALDRALGREHEPLTPRLPVPPYFAEQPFAEPIAREDDVLAVTARLATRLRGMLERRGQGARRIELSLFRTDGAVRRLAAGTSRPVRDPHAVRALFAERLAALGDELDPGFGFDLARLSVLTAEALPPEQIGLGDAESMAAFDGLIDRLGARLGSRRVGRLIAQDSHIPELSALAVPAQSTAVNIDTGWAAFRRFRASVDLSPRPLRLLARPEAIEVTPMTVDAPPVRFRWRRAWHDVVVADGPERIEGAWWSEEGGPARDYFRVEDGAGRRFWLFRAGLYRDRTEAHWFMHGLFA